MIYVVIYNYTLYFCAKNIKYMKRLVIASLFLFPFLWQIPWDGQMFKMRENYKSFSCFLNERILLP